MNPWKIDSVEYLVYALTSPEGKVYVGKSRARWNELWKRQRYGRGYKNHKELYADIVKFGWKFFKRELVAEHLTKSEASKLEAETIAERNSLYPNGYNKETGGDKGYKTTYHTPSDKPRLAGIRTYAMLSLEQKEAMRLAHIKPVAQCTDEGVPIKIWESIKDASEALGIDKGNISHSARHERAKAGGFVWRFVDELINIAEQDM